MSRKGKRAGARYAKEQFESDYFMTWYREQVYESFWMDPSKVLPLETMDDARVIARNMLQELEWGIRGELNESPEFFEGVVGYLNRPAVINELAENVLDYHEYIKRMEGDDIEVGEAKRKRHPEMAGGVVEFAELLKSLVDTQGRYLFVRTEHRLGGPSHYFESAYVNFVNLPEEVVASRQGGGAEAENNRMSFWVEGFNGSDPNAPPPTGKVKVSLQTSALPREYRLRAKTAPPGAIAQYLADFLNKVVREVPPKYTHSQPPGEAREARRRAPRKRTGKPVRYKHDLWEVLAWDGDWRTRDQMYGYAGGKQKSVFWTHEEAKEFADNFMRRNRPMGTDAKVTISETTKRGDTYWHETWGSDDSGWARPSAWTLTRPGAREVLPPEGAREEPRVNARQHHPIVRVVITEVGGEKCTAMAYDDRGYQRTGWTSAAPCAWIERKVEEWYPGVPVEREKKAPQQRRRKRRRR